MADIIVDTKEIDRLAKDIVAAKNQLLGRLAERGYALLAGRIVDGKQGRLGGVPVATGNLSQGVAPPSNVYEGVQVEKSKNEQGVTKTDFRNMTAELIVSARTAVKGGRTAQVFNADGKPTGKTVSLRPSPAFNYAESVARGRPAISPKSGQALLMPITTAKDKKGKSIGYLLSSGQMYRVVKSAKAVPPNPYDVRAARRLEIEAPVIAENVLRKFV